MTSSTETRIQRFELNDITKAIRQEGGYVVAVISDVHLGHGRVHASKVIKGLDSIFPDERLRALNMVMITGDLFDKRLTYDSDDAQLITRWVEIFLRRCAKFGVAVRILEGTPSHDNKQSRWLPLVAELANINLDIKYYGTITIDELYEGGPLALYVPDEMNHDANDTWMQVNELLRQRGVSEVQYAFMHGMFTYQEPIRTVVSHSVENYHRIVTQRIYIGHHHTHTTCGRIVVPGSLERLRHNEEEEKGHLQFTIMPDHSVTDEYFIPNPLATVFSTLDVKGLELKKAIKLLEGYEHLPQGSNLRLELSRDDATYAGLAEIKSRFPQYYITTKVVEADAYTPDTTDLIDRPVITAIRPDTINDMLRARIKDVEKPVLDCIERILAEAA
jgi:DNA repair exonuclease SbcCD nuclease subunit